MAITISIFQTIQTKWISPTNFKGTQIKAKTASGISIVRGYDYGLNIGENHAKVARELQEKMKWDGPQYGDMVGGQNADGSYTWVMVGSDNRCAVCNVAGPEHGHYDVTDQATHKFVSR